VNAIYVWGVARALGGRVLLRIEDHDRIRSRPEYDDALLEDLGWLGFVADWRPVRQSDSAAAYEEALARLARSHHVYACDCSRKEVGLAARAGPAMRDDGTADVSYPRAAEMTYAASGTSLEVRYPGRCRTRGLAFDRGCGVRVEMRPGTEAFDDGLVGRQEQNPAAQCGDLLIRDRDGHWTYQFAVTVDDMRQQIDLVVRGEDLLSSTGRQTRLARMLGREAPPVFLHHPLILKPSGEKLSKASGDTGVRELRAAGLSAAGIIGRAAVACGLAKGTRDIRANEVETLFV
jgi:glutamyl-tRNA synthetase/glutamyl-Q tRNA(Asp) synthetase